MHKLRRRVEQLQGGESAYVQIPEVIGGARLEIIAVGWEESKGAVVTDGMRIHELIPLRTSMRNADRIAEITKTGMRPRAWRV